MAIPATVLGRDDVLHAIPPMKMVDATTRLRLIEKGDLAGIAGLNGDPFELQFHRADARRLRACEWGIVREATPINPDCILISGGAAGVQFGDFLAEGLVPLAHSHPYHDKNPISTRVIAGGGAPWNDINGVNPIQNLAARLQVFPSAGDAVFCTANGLANHRVETPYVVVTSGAGVLWICNPDAHPAFAQAPRLNFIINATVFGRRGQHSEISLTARRNELSFWFKSNIKVDGQGAQGIDL